MDGESQRLKDDFELNLPWRFPFARQHIFAVTLLTITIAIIYSNSFHCTWHYDDFTNIVENSNIHLTSLTLDALKKVFYGTHIEPIFGQRPLAYLSFALNYYHSGLSVFGYHLVNVVIHTLTSVVLFLLIFNILRLPSLTSRYGNIAYSVALLASFSWAAHPIQLTAVTYIVQRMTALATLCYTFSMYSYLKARTSEKRAIFWWLCVLVSFLLALASKENAILLPFSLLLFDLLLITGFSAHSLKIFRRLFLFSAIPILAISFFLADPVNILDGYELRPFSLAERLLTQPRVLLLYLSLIIYPTSSRLNLLHDIDISTGLLTPLSTFPAILIVAALIGTGIFLSRRWPLWSFAILFYFLNHAIESSFVPLEMTYEHRNYLPSQFLFVLFSLGTISAIRYFHQNKSLKVAVAATATAYIAGYAHTTYVRNHIFRSELTLWKDVIRKSPRLSIAYNNLGRAMKMRGETQKAFIEYRKALSIDRFMNNLQKGIVHYNLALYFTEEKKEYQVAREHLLEALRVRAGYKNIWIQLSKVYALLDDLKRSEETIKRALVFWKEDAELLSNLSVIRYKTGNQQQALSLAYQVHAKNPTATTPLSVMAAVASERAKPLLALRYCEQIAALAPYDIRNNLRLVELYDAVGMESHRDKKAAWLLGIDQGETIATALQKHALEDNIKVYIPQPKKLVPILLDVLSRQKQILRRNFPLPEDLSKTTKTKRIIKDSRGGLLF